MNLLLRKNGGEVLVPFYEPLGLFGETDTLFKDMWSPWRPFDLNDSLMPSTDIYEEDGHLIMKTELPGIDKKDLDISLEGDRLTIKAERKEEVKEDAKHHAREMYYGRYYRTVMLPYRVNEEKISATYDNGVLELKLPKAKELKTRKIEIKGRLPEAPETKRQLKAKPKKSK